MSQPIYFPGLNGIRFVAATAVIVWHTEAFKQMAGLPSAAGLPLMPALGLQGVNLFFVLSGFLITYLLLREISTTGRVDVMKFYARRMLRIWPLYFLLVGLGLFVLPHVLVFEPLSHHSQGNMLAKLTLFAVMLPNVALVVYGHLAFLGPLWSIGVEEQFYLAWPALMKRFGKNPGRLLISLVILIVGLRAAWAVFYSLARARWGPVAAIDTLNLVVADLRFECMAIGGITAWILHQPFKRVTEVLFHPATQAVSYGVIAAVVLTNGQPPVIGHALMAAAFAVAIANIARNPASFIHLDSSLCNFMGRISYGMYMFHSIAIVVGIHVLTRWINAHQAPIVFNTALYLATFAATVAVAAVSYRWFESPVLRLKDRYAVVASTSRAPDETSTLARLDATQHRRAA